MNIKLVIALLLSIALNIYLAIENGEIKKNIQTIHNATIYESKNTRTAPTVVTKTPDTNTLNNINTHQANAMPGELTQSAAKNAEPHLSEIVDQEQPQNLPNDINYSEYTNDIAPRRSEALSIQYRDTQQRFYQFDNTQKLAIINETPASGNGLLFLSDIAVTESDPEIRLSAINQLSKSNSYQSKTTLLQLLEDSSFEVASAATDALIKSGDRSLAQALSELSYQVSDPLLQDKLMKSATQLEYSATMQSDNLDESE